MGLAVSFMGYKVLHLYERFSWIPTMAAAVVAIGCGGKYLYFQVASEGLAASTIMSYGAIVVRFTISWCVPVSGFSVYISPDIPV